MNRARGTRSALKMQGTVQEEGCMERVSPNERLYISILKEPSLRFPL